MLSNFGADSMQAAGAFEPAIPYLLWYEKTNILNLRPLGDSASAYLWHQSRNAVRGATSRLLPSVDVSPAVAVASESRVTRAETTDRSNVTFMATDIVHP